MNPLNYPYCTGMMSPFGRNLTASIMQVRIFFFHIGLIIEANLKILWYGGLRIVGEHLLRILLWF